MGRGKGVTRKDALGRDRITKIEALEPDDLFMLEDQLHIYVCCRFIKNEAVHCYQEVATGDVKYSSDGLYVKKLWLTYNQKSEMIKDERKKNRKKWERS